MNVNTMDEAMSSIHLMAAAQAQSNIASSEQAALLATKQGAPMKSVLCP